MGGGGAASRGGRYEKGGQQVISLFDESTDNDKIKTIYGNYGFWSWLRYWFIDSENYTALMLADKTYYDSDYIEPKPKRKTIIKPKSKEELGAMLARFGFDTKLRSSKPKSMSPDELQRIVMEEQKAASHD